MPTPNALPTHDDITADSVAKAFGGDVVMGRPDAAGGEDIVVAVAQRVKGRDDVGFLVGDDTDFLEVDPDSGQIFGDETDVLVLGPPGQELVADHQNSRGDDLAHAFSSPSIIVPLPSQHLEVTGFCCRNKHPPAIFSGKSLDRPYQMTPANAYRAGPGLATIPFSHALFRMASKKCRDIWQLRSTK